MYAAVIGLGVSLIAALRTAGGDPAAVRGGAPAAERLDALTTALAQAVRDQWETEERIRRIHVPFPLPVRWTAAEPGITDHWPVINPSPGATEPVCLAGQGDQIADVYARIASGRLVVLGRAGAGVGKSVLAARLVLTLLDRRGRVRAGTGAAVARRPATRSRPPIPRSPSRPGAGRASPTGCRPPGGSCRCWTAPTRSATACTSPRSRNSTAP